MMAEVVVDVLNSALGVTENFGTEAPPGMPGHRGRRQPLAEPGRAPTPSASSAGRRAPRPATANGPWSRPCRRRCICMTDPSLLAKLSATDRPPATLLKTKMTDDEVLDELFLATLTPPADRAENRPASPTIRPKTTDRDGGLHRHAVGADQHAGIYFESLGGPCSRNRGVIRAGIRSREPLIASGDSHAA